MEIIETQYRNRIGLSCKIIGKLSETDVINYFDRLRNKDIFSLNPHFKRKEINLI